MAAKASLVFPMLLVFPLFALVRFRSGRALWQAVAVTAFMALLVLLQYLYVFETGSEQTIYKAAGFVGEANSHVRIDLFHVWSHYSHDVPLSIAASCVFPLVALVAYGRRLIDYDLVRYALALMAVSIAIFAIFTETGVREFHGNFIWQAMVANYLLFLTVLIRVWTLWSYRREPVRSVAVAGAFTAHVLAGFAFLVYYFANGTYF